MSCESFSGDEEYEKSLVTKRHYLKPTVVEVEHMPKHLATDCRKQRRCPKVPLPTIICHYLPKCGKCSLPMWYICTVICQRRSPFGSRSMFDRFPLVLRYSFVRPSFVLRSVSVREARCNGDVTDKEKIRNKPGYQSQRSLICCVTKWRHHHSKCRKNHKTCHLLDGCQQPESHRLKNTFFREDILTCPEKIYFIPQRRYTYLPGEDILHPTEKIY